MKDNAVIIGLQYGDEGKGRVSAHFIDDYDWSVRYSGGSNAGHTVYDEAGVKYKLHHLPAGAVFGKKVALHAGMVVNESELMEEYKALSHNFPLYISEAVHLTQPEHLAKDAQGSGIGSTKKGIAYVYADRAARKGIRAETLKKKYSALNFYKGMPPLKPGERALYEGAQGIMLDIDYGNYPYVTSSSIGPSIFSGISRVIGVMKAYVSRVGDGPPYHQDQEALRKAGQEYGTTTGRPRKCFWLDLDQMDYALSVVNPDEIVVTKLDILDGMKIKVIEFGREKEIGDLDAYKNFLINRFPAIKWFSDSPKGSLIKI